MANIATNTVTPLSNTFPARIAIHAYNSAALTATQVLVEFPMPCNGRIIAVVANAFTAGVGAGNGVLDILIKSGTATTYTSAYTTTANRPTLVGANTGEFAAELPDTRILQKGDVVQLQSLSIPATTGHARVGFVVLVGMP